MQAFEPNTTREVPSPLPPQSAERTLRLLSYNIQVGIRTERFRQYLTHGWKHLLPDERRRDNLDLIADLLGDYDVVALQEVDAGSLRSGFLNQVAYLADQAGFPYWYSQCNRDLGILAQHGNAVLTRVEPELIQDHKLPGMIPGRGAILVQLGEGEEALAVVILHLSLGPRAQDQQLAYIRRLVRRFRHVVVVGDLNIKAARLMEHPQIKLAGLTPLSWGHQTYPSWKPSVGLDHVLVSPEIDVKAFRVLDCQLSDHLPIEIEIEVPREMGRAA
jgi:endonuclease/exonuclease/phosphatase family metal-dependent hydrolase